MISTADECNQIKECRDRISQIHTHWVVALLRSLKCFSKQYKSCKSKYSDYLPYRHTVYQLWCDVFTGCSGSKVPKISASNTQKYLGTKNIWNIILYLSMIHLCIHDFYFNFLLLCLVKLTYLKMPEIILLLLNRTWWHRFCYFFVIIGLYCIWRK